MGRKPEHMEGLEPGERMSSQGKRKEMQDVGAEPGECLGLGSKNVSKGNRSSIFLRLNSEACCSGPAFTRFYTVLRLLLLGRPDTFLLKIFLRWTIFKAFIELVTILFLFYFILFIFEACGILVP